MNERIEHCLYAAGLTADGCWDELDSYAKEGIEKFAELLIKECIYIVSDCSVEYCTRPQIVSEIKQNFGLSNE